MLDSEVPSFHAVSGIGVFSKSVLVDVFGSFAQVSRPRVSGEFSNVKRLLQLSSLAVPAVRA